MAESPSVKRRDERRTLSPEGDVEPTKVGDRRDSRPGRDRIGIAELQAERFRTMRIVIDRLSVVADRGDVRRLEVCTRDQLESALGEEAADGDIERSELPERGARRLDELLHACEQRRRERRRASADDAALVIADLYQDGVDAIDARSGKHAEVQVIHWMRTAFGQEPC